MKQVVDVWGTVTGTRDAAVQNLFLRGQSLVWRQQIAGKRGLRTIPVRRLRAGEEMPRDLVKKAADWIKKAEELAVSDARGWEALEGTRVRQEVPTVEQVLAAYGEAARRLGAPSHNTVRDCSSSLLLVIRAAKGIEKPAALAARCSILDGELPVEFAHAMLEDSDDEEATRRSISSTLRQARAVFSRSMLEEYGKLKLPPLERFLRRKAVEDVKVSRAPFSMEEIALLKKGAELRESSPDIYAVWFLAYYCGLRAGEIAQARAAWVQDMAVPEELRAAFSWLKDRRTVPVLNLADDVEFRAKTPASAGYIPLADDVAAEIRRMAAGREYIIPGTTPTARHELSHRTFQDWLRGLGWKRNKVAHALRAYRLEVWAHRHNDEIRRAWGRHAQRGVEANYISRLNLSRQPFGLGE